MELETRQLDDVVRRPQRRKAQPLIGKPSKQAPKLILGPCRLADTADVMKTGRERVLSTAKGLGETTWLEMLFEDKNVATVLCQRSRCSQPTDSRTDDDRIVTMSAHGDALADSVGSSRPTRCL